MTKVNPDFAGTGAILCNLGDVDCARIWPTDGGSWLDKEDWLVWNGVVGFFGVVVVVESRQRTIGDS